MKKSYDYSKTLKELSLCVQGAYIGAVTGSNIKSYLIKFSGLKNELSECLIDDFVTPFERGDIYNLAFCMHKELWQIDELYNYSSLADIGSFLFAGQIGDLFQKQNEIVDLLFFSKNIHKVSRVIDEGMNLCSGIKNRVLGNLKKTLRESEQPLVAYGLNCAYLTLLERIDITFSDMERILIVKS